MIKERGSLNIQIRSHWNIVLTLPWRALPAHPATSTCVLAGQMLRHVVSYCVCSISRTESALIVSVLGCVFNVVGLCSHEVATRNFSAHFSDNCREPAVVLKMQLGLEI